jgi:hypothetical protein
MPRARMTRIQRNGSWNGRSQWPHSLDTKCLQTFVQRQTSRDASVTSLKMRAYIALISRCQLRLKRSQRQRCHTDELIINKSRARSDVVRLKRRKCAVWLLGCSSQYKSKQLDNRYDKLECNGRHEVTCEYVWTIRYKTSLSAWVWGSGASVRSGRGIVSSVSTSWRIQNNVFGRKTLAR